MKADLRVIGPQASFGRYLVAGGTAIEAGEPTHRVGQSYTTGTTDVNTFVLAAVDTPKIGTHEFGGVALAAAELAAAGTVLEQFLNCAVPVPQIGRIRGKALTSASVDTAAELYALIGDLAMIDYNSTGGSDGGEGYTIVEGAADTDGLQIVGGNVALLELEVVIDNRAFRSDVTA